MTLGSLFDGIGGFPLCAVLSGITPVWAAEVDPACVAVTKQRFPTMIHLGDVSKINGAKIPPVDIITFGSPCQDLSVAGERRGLKHSANGDEETTRSGLFIDAIRIITEMREATNGSYPTYIVWENVEGAFNSRGGRDFQTVLEKITKTDIPIPASGRWAKSGVVRGRGICVAWRLFDAQYWGVPQRRKRIYLIGSFGSDSAAEILFERDSVQRYLTPREEKREAAPAAAENSFGGASGFLDRNSARARGIGYQEEVIPTLRAGMLPSVIQGNALAYDARGNGDGGTSPTITGDHNSRVTDYTTLVLQAAGFHGQNSITAANPEFREELSPTLTTTKKADVVYAIGNGQADQTGLHEIVGALNCMHDQQAVCYRLDCRNIKLNETLYPTLQAKENGGISLNFYESLLYKTLYTLKWIVRRLTPRECERLQGYPDDWTVLPKISDMNDEEYEFYKTAFLLDKAIRGKKVAKEPNKKQLIRWYNNLDNDGARYRMLGNSLAIPCALRVIGGISEYEKNGGDIP